MKRHIQEVHQAKHDVKAKRRCAETELEPEQRQGISSRTVEQKHDLGTTDDGDMIETTSANQTAGLPSDHNSSKDLDKGDLIAKQRDEMADCNDENNNAMRSSPVTPELHSNGIVDWSVDLECQSRNLLSLAIPQSCWAFRICVC
ncbi:unnamed protein product [Anisakis simplex]|uniref:Uncharacterized protein n=1 Tax=Anisakis simplex TaxID=6269 RepID=A0A3P6NVV7_ANISI|nr:unnamed protein product [Anisakis simplex]